MPVTDSLHAAPCLPEHRTCCCLFNPSKTQVSRCLCPAQTLSMIYQITFWLLGPSFKELHALVPNYLFRLTSHDCSTFPISSSEIEEPLLPGSSATGSPIERHHGPSRASTEYFLLSITASVYLLLRNTYMSSYRPIIWNCDFCRLTMVEWWEFHTVWPPILHSKEWYHLLFRWPIRSPKHSDHAGYLLCWAWRFFQ